MTYSSAFPLVLQEPPAKKKPSGAMLEAYRAFCAAGRMEGYTFAQTAAAWKLSAVRRVLIEGMTEAQRKKGKFEL